MKGVLEQFTGLLSFYPGKCSPYGLGERRLVFYKALVAKC